ncbi:unnamed protein product [Miscanthus lutarioriparius]|uniref:Gag1-like clamp domain-containing protein n=1 Tax=Miscanthus lutarioriparius TaxID=422564 RepID=A0A811PYC7_9POAL|nr:unnamed protein product [Miscanthus lutarioriparius]
MENSALQSRHSMSSISTAAQPNDQHASGSSSSPNEFVNQGLLLWHQTRQQWIGKRRRNSQGQQSQEPNISCNATYESLLGSSKPFPQPIPLGVRYLENLHSIFHFLTYASCLDNALTSLGCLLSGNGGFPRGQLGAGRPIRLELVIGSVLFEVTL